METYSAVEVCELVGITYRQLDYWCRQGFIPQMNRYVGSGCQRRFSEGQLAAVRQVKEIMDEIASLKGELDAMRDPIPAFTSPSGYRTTDWRLARTG